MYYKRNESYRFVFNQPVEGKLTKREDNNTVTTDVRILDASNEGAKIYCKSAIEFKKNTEIQLSFKLNSTSFHTSGIVKWTKKFQNTLELGLHLNTDDEYKSNIIMELKEIAKQKDGTN